MKCRHWTVYSLVPLRLPSSSGASRQSGFKLLPKHLPTRLRSIPPQRSKNVHLASSGTPATITSGYRQAKPMASVYLRSSMLSRDQKQTSQRQFETYRAYVHEPGWCHATAGSTGAATARLSSRRSYLLGSSRSKDAIA